MSTCLHQVQLRTAVPARELSVFPAEDFRVIDGVNEGDALTDASDLAYEDVYALSGRAAPLRLGLVTPRAGGAFRVSPDSGVGQPGARVYLDSLLTLMDSVGSAREGLVFVEVDRDGIIAEVYLHPLTWLPRDRGHTLVTIDREGAAARLDRTAGPAFLRGAPVAFAGGARHPVEALRLAPGC